MFNDLTRISRPNMFDIMTPKTFLAALAAFALGAARADRFLRGEDTALGRALDRPDALCLHKRPGTYCVSNDDDRAWKLERLTWGTTTSTCSDSFYRCDSRGKLVNGGMERPRGNVKCVYSLTADGRSTAHFVASQHAFCAAPTSSKTPSASQSKSFSATGTGTRSITPTGTGTVSRTSTSSSTGTATASSSQTSTSTGTASPSATATSTSTTTNSVSATSTSTSSFSPSSTGTGTSSITSTASSTGSQSPTATSSASGTGTATSSYSASISQSSTPTSSATQSETPTSSGSASGTSSPSATTSASATESGTSSSSSLPTTSNTAASTVSPTSVPIASSPSSSSTPLPSRTASATRSKSQAATVSRTASRAASRSPSVTTSPAGCFTTAAGVQNNLLKSNVECGGWTVCHESSYGQGFNGDAVASWGSITSACNGNSIMVACYGSNMPNVLKVAASAPKSDVFFDTGVNTATVHAANGVNWYFNAEWSFGFAPTGTTVNKNSCDISSTSANKRLCIHAWDASEQFGYRCGEQVDINSGVAASGEQFYRVFYTR